jgi:4-hydroxythreonine-4-phosphate dehydrogenase
MVTLRSLAPRQLQPPLAVTMGDAAGIGPEIIVKAWRARPDLVAHSVVVGDLAVMRRAVALWGDGLEVAVVNALAHLAMLPRGVIPVKPVTSLDSLPVHGQLSGASGKAAAQCVIEAAQMALRGEVSAMVTAPLNKEAMALGGVTFPGHTELLAHQAALFQGLAQPLPVRMMLMNDALRVVLLSIHVPLRQALAAVTQENILQTLSITNASLHRMLGRAPVIFVSGLNPHAGENGLMGDEERNVIAPALALAKAQGLKVEGPFPPDTVFMNARARFEQPGAPDIVLAMYHDQGLIPVKYMGLEHGVNVTLGLPFVRASPDHGTGFDIAGLSQADPSSLVRAIEVARQLSLPVG